MKRSLFGRGHCLAAAIAVSLLAAPALAGELVVYESKDGKLAANLSLPELSKTTVNGYVLVKEFADDSVNIYDVGPNGQQTLIRRFSPHDALGHAVAEVRRYTFANTKFYKVLMDDTDQVLTLGSDGLLQDKEPLDGRPVGSSADVVSAPAVGAKIYITLSGGNGAVINGAIYQATLSTTGVLSLPKRIFTFPGGAGGGTPTAPAVVGPGGALYGVTASGGDTAVTACMTAGLGCGVAYRLKPVTTGGVTVWHEDVLYTFTGGSDGNIPNSRLAFDGGGNAYGTTMLGGDLASPSAQHCVGPFNSHLGCGVIFRLTHSATVPWPHKTLHPFHDRADGAMPQGPVTLDAGGNVFGTTIAGGKVGASPCLATVLGGQTPGCGVVFKLAKGSWLETVRYAFSGLQDGSQPAGPVWLDGSGNLWGTTFGGGFRANPCQAAGGGGGWSKGCGVVFKISP